MLKKFTHSPLSGAVAQRPEVKTERSRMSHFAGRTERTPLAIALLGANANLLLRGLLAKCLDEGAVADITGNAAGSAGAAPVLIPVRSTAQLSPRNRFPSRNSHFRK